MKYGIYDYSLEVWVKSTLSSYDDGIPVTENKSAALFSEDKRIMEELLEATRIHWNRKGKSWMTKPLEVREIK